MKARLQQQHVGDHLYPGGSAHTNKLWSAIVHLWQNVFFFLSVSQWKVMLSFKSLLQQFPLNPIQKTKPLSAQDIIHRLPESGLRCGVCLLHLLQTLVIFATTLSPVDSKPFDLKFFFFPLHQWMLETPAHVTSDLLFSPLRSHTEMRAAGESAPYRKKERDFPVFIHQLPRVFFIFYFFFNSTMFNTLDLLFWLRVMTWAKAPFIRDDTVYFNLCSGHYDTLLICCIGWAIRQQHVAPDLSTY